jgi:2-methylcitrate dehydratase PrpD
LGWHSTATLGTFGALAAACKMLRLEEEQVVMAFGIASSLASGIKKNFGTMTKPLHAGNAAKNGIIAASLAQKGFTADDDVFEGPNGLFDVFTNKTDVDLGNVIASLGNPLDIIEPGTNIKAYPCCAFGREAIDAILSMIKREHLLENNIDCVECGVHYRTRQVMRYSEPQTSLEGKFSLEYCVAVAIMDKTVGLDQFTDEKVNSSSIKELIKKIKVYVHPELQTLESFGNRFAEVTVHTEDNGVYRERVYSSLGTPEKPLSDNELQQKFLNCAKSILRRGEIDRVIQLITHLEELKNINDLMDVLVFGTN